MFEDRYFIYFLFRKVGPSIVRKYVQKKLTHWFGRQKLSNNTKKFWSSNKTLKVAVLVENSKFIFSYYDEKSCCLKIVIFFTFSSEKLVRVLLGNSKFIFGYYDKKI